MTTNTRVLYVTAGFPFPMSSGYLRHNHLLRQLVPDHEIHLLSLVGPSFRPDHVDGVRDFVGPVQTFPRSPRRAGRTARLLDPGRPDAGARALARAALVEIEAGRVDAVVLSGKDTAAVADVARGRVPLVVDLCDATSARLTQELSLTRGARRGGLWVRRRGLRRVEQHLIASADRLLVASARDRDLLAAEGGGDRARRAIVMPNGIDLDRWHRTRPSLGDSVVFCGNLGYRPNADAARQLVHQVMPHVWARHPDAEVTIIGTGASAALQAELQRSLVTLTGEVPDVRPYLETAAVFAAPLRIAAGIQNKVLEAMAMELPVVTSSVAAAGLVTDGQRPPIAVADDPATAGAAIAIHLDDVRQGRSEPRHEARAWVGERFQWARSGRALATAISEAGNEAMASC